MCMHIGRSTCQTGTIVSGVKNLKLAAVTPAALVPRSTVMYRATASATSASTMCAPCIASADRVSGRGFENGSYASATAQVRGPVQTE